MIELGDTATLAVPDTHKVLNPDTETVAELGCMFTFIDAELEQDPLLALHEYAKDPATLDFT